MALSGGRTERPMAPEIPLGKQRPAEFVFDRVVAGAVEELHGENRSAGDTGSVAAE